MHIHQLAVHGAKVRQLLFPVEIPGKNDMDAREYNQKDAGNLKEYLHIYEFRRQFAALTVSCKDARALRRKGRSASKDENALRLCTLASLRETVSAANVIFYH